MFIRYLLLAMSLFLSVAAAGNCWAQLEINSLDDNARQLIQLNQSFQQKLTSLKIRFHTDFLQQKEKVLENTSLDCEVWRVGENHRVKTMTSLPGMFKLSYVDELSLNGGTSYKSLRFRDPADPSILSKLTPCKQLGLRAKQTTFTENFWSLQLGRVLVDVSLSLDSMELSDLIERKGVRVEFLGDSEIDGHRCAKLEVSFKSKESSGIEMRQFWIDREYGFIWKVQGDADLCFIASECIEVPGVGRVPTIITILDNYEKESQYVHVKTKILEFDVSHEDLNDSNLGFRFPKYSCVHYSEHIPDGTFDPTSEFRVIGDTEDQILFRTKDDLVELNDWCLKNGFPGRDPNLPNPGGTASNQKMSNQKMPMFSYAGIAGVFLAIFALCLGIYFLKR